MDYITAWEKSTGWAIHWFNKWKPKKIEFDDYYQECALYFWGKLKNSFEPEKCWCYSKVAYKRIMIRLVYREKESKLRTESLENRDWLCDKYDDCNFWEVQLKPYLQKVAELVAYGYETAEICTLTGKTVETIYTDIKNIKRIYANELGITNYQRKHLRSFTRRRTEKEIETWEKNRLRAVQELRKRAKCLQTHEKSRQCAI